MEMRTDIYHISMPITDIRIQENKEQSLWKLKKQENVCVFPIGNSSSYPFVHIQII